MSPHVLRVASTPEVEAFAGDPDLPDGYGGSVVEVAMLLGLKSLGASIGRLPPGATVCPLHRHHLEEEIFVLLEGELEATELAVGADTVDRFVLRTGDVVVYPAGDGPAHQNHNRTDEDARYLCLSSPWHPQDLIEYPASGKIYLRSLGREGLGVLETGAEVLEGGPRTWPVRKLAPAQRPARVVTMPSVEDHGTAEYLRTLLGSTPGARALEVEHVMLPPHGSTGEPYWHTAVEELFLVLHGHPVLSEWVGGERMDTGLQPNDVAGWPAGTRVARQLRAEGSPVSLLRVTLLARGDAVVYPMRGELFVPALNRRGRLTSTSYWYGE